ncbi:GNAT family N-acetyltransferase [Salinirubellus salinus]|uniref:tRNA(Met) cytidine acetyltransferase TmcA n=1 Tax=Salinirubellus salinus TaxID=1364945 RepID=A0A9E7R4M8_9EURY|nr:tRNA(Met) cytidine acetyltransferase TmcA [Salinirubellus salinus]UWM55790.1 GNAT family N-acetyltransferase [Salinirubellus salinus]
MLADAVRALREEALATNERRLLVLAGSREATADAAERALDAADVPMGDRTVVADRRICAAEELSLDESTSLLGTTRTTVVLDCHDQTRPNAIGRAVGAVDGGGLLVLLTPPLDAWPTAPDGLADSLAAPPFTADAVTGHFRRRLVDTLRAHPGVAIYDADSGTLERDGLTHPALRVRWVDDGGDGTRGDRTFPEAAYDACLTDDQRAAVAALESLHDAGVVVLSADRGRGKSSAAGLAAGALVAEGRRVLVTAPGSRNAREVLARAEELLESLGSLDGADGRRVVSTTGGELRFLDPPEATHRVGEFDAVVVDEAAALPVDTLAAFLAGPPVAYATTVHGYEGTGRGFDVRFRDRLADAGREVTDVTMTEPIRYAAGDPVEVWAFRALLLDAGPPADQLVTDAAPDACEYRTLDAEALLADENRLREAFGLLVLAHYRTEPDDLARLLDAPNVAVRALLHDGHVVAVALLAREGGLSADRRRRMYEGERVRGNMLPDLLTSQLRDEDAGEPVGVRVLRIATHHAVRSRGLGSRLLDEVVAELRAGGPWPDPVDYLGVGYGATPDLLRFWERNGFRSVHLSTTRNDRSGEHSALMVRPLTDAGRELHDRSATFLARRLPSVLADALDGADPDVVRGVLAATDAPVPLDLTAREWRLVASAAYGPGMYDAAPRPFRGLATRALVDGVDALDASAERLLVRKVLQARDWEWVADDLSYVSKRATMRSLGDAYRPLVDRYGTDVAAEEAARYR